MRRWGQGLGCVVLSLLLLTGCDIAIGGTPDPSKILNTSTFIDDVGNKIEIEGIYNRIISLSTTHTENLYYLGVADCLIGVDTGSIYPARVADLPRYSLTSELDMDRLMKEEPELVLITPDINKKYPSVVSKLESNGLLVVSLMPKSIEHFDYYIKKLAMLTDTEDRAIQLLSDFHNELQRIRQQTNAIEPKKSVFVETSQRGYLTAAKGSLIYEAIATAGGDNIVEKAKPSILGETQIKYGFDKIYENRDHIDVYFTLQGVKNGGGSMISMAQQNKFDAIKAIREGEVYELLYPLIGQYTFRYVIGVQEIARTLYPEIFSSPKEWGLNTILTREAFADIVFEELKLPVFTITKKDYYDFTKYHHTYGRFLDVTYKDLDFNRIETVTMKGYLLPKRDEPGREFFRRYDPVTKAEIASFIYILKDISSSEKHISIRDIKNHKDERIITKVVDQGYMELQDGCFYPENTITTGEFYDLLEVIKVGSYD